MFRAFVVDQREGVVSGSLRELQEEALPQGDVLVQVAYSSLNYKDGLAVTGAGKVVRSYPMVPGIDYAGTVVESHSPAYRRGDRVILTGWGAGERVWGGFAELARTKAEWLVPLPRGMTLRQAMAIGTAGFTAMLSVMALEEHGVLPDGRAVAVTGAAGGVGSIAVALLAKLGYLVTASTGRAETHEYLRSLGAKEILDRSVLAAPSGRPLESERWGGAIDTVGGETLASLLAATATHGSVAACGLAGGAQLTTTVMPFILRGVNLLGIDSNTCPIGRRRQAWERLSRDLPVDLLEMMTHEITLEQVPVMSAEILKGRVRGRTVVNIAR